MSRTWDLSDEERAWLATRLRQAIRTTFEQSAPVAGMNFLTSCRSVELATQSDTQLVFEVSLSVTISPSHGNLDGQEGRI
jgi:hypothetical protein